MKTTTLKTSATIEVMSAVCDHFDALHGSLFLIFSPPVILIRKSNNKRTDDTDKKHNPSNHR